MLTKFVCLGQKLPLSFISSRQMKKPNNTKVFYIGNIGYEKINIEIAFILFLGQKKGESYFRLCCFFVGCYINFCETLIYV